MSSSDKDKLIVVSGIPPDNSGTGRMMRQLMSNTQNGEMAVRFVHKFRPSKPIRELARRKDWKEVAVVSFFYLAGQAWFYVQILHVMVFGSGKLLLMHPQTIGFRLTAFLIRIWRRNQVYMYILDSSYFCVRSYNHVPGEWAACTRCIGGHFDQRRIRDCPAFPIEDKNAGWYTEQLHRYGKAGRLKFLSQNHTQKALIKKHFGSDTDVHVVGLWGEDWDEAIQKPDSRNKHQAVDAVDAPIIVFHGFYVPAKGADWFIELARLCPELNFLCAHPRASLIKDAPNNIEFRNVMWNTGLEQIVEDAFMVFVPSLWSAPIEGALIKSVAIASRVATVENDTAFQNEMSDEIILRMSSTPEIAAQQLQQAVAVNWTPDKQAVHAWLEKFQRENRDFCNNIISSIRAN